MPLTFIRDPLLSIGFIWQRDVIKCCFLKYFYIREGLLAANLFRVVTVMDPQFDFTLNALSLFYSDLGSSLGVD